MVLGLRFAWEFKETKEKEKENQDDKVAQQCPESGSQHRWSLWSHRPLAGDTDNRGGGEALCSASFLTCL
jgi:hypothetical protein